MDKKYKGSSCELVDAYVILTRQGVVLASDDAKLTAGEDRALREMNLRLIDRSKKTDVDGNFRSWLRAQAEMSGTASQEGYTQEEALEMLKIYQLAEINKGKSGNV